MSYIIIKPRITILCRKCRKILYILHLIVKFNIIFLIHKILVFWWTDCSRLWKPCWLQVTIWLLLKHLILHQLISWYWISGPYKVWTPLCTFNLFYFDFRSLIWYLTGRRQSIVILSVINTWHMSQALRWIAVSKLLLVRILFFNRVRRSKSLTTTTILYYISIYLLNFMILRKLRWWILLIDTLSLIHLIKVILLKIISLLRFD